MPSLVTATNVTLQDVIVVRREDFLKMMCAKDIALSLRVYGHITETVEHDITYAKSREDANGHLFTFLTEKASDEQVQGTFKFASEKKDYGKMSKFAASILQQLQQGQFLYIIMCRYVDKCIYDVYARHGTMCVYTGGSACRCLFCMCMCLL